LAWRDERIEVEVSFSSLLFTYDALRRVSTLG